MEHMEPRLRAFWIIHLITLGIFGLELLFVLSIWLRGRVPGLPAEASGAAKLWTVIKRTVRTIFSRRLWVALKALVLDGMIHIPLMRKNLPLGGPHCDLWQLFVVGHSVHHYWHCGRDTAS